MYTDKSFLQIHIYTVLAAVFHLLIIQIWCLPPINVPSPCHPFIFYLILLQSVKLQVLGLSSWFFVRKSLYHHMDSQELWCWWVCRLWGALQGFFWIVHTLNLFWRCKKPSNLKVPLVVCCSSSWCRALLEDECGISGLGKSQAEHWCWEKEQLCEQTPAIPAEILQWSGTGALGKAPVHGLQELLKSAGVAA